MICGNVEQILAQMQMLPTDVLLSFFGGGIVLQYQSFTHLSYPSWILINSLKIMCSVWPVYSKEAKWWKRKHNGRWHQHDCCVSKGCLPEAGLRKTIQFLHFPRITFYTVYRCPTYDFLPGTEITVSQLCTIDGVLPDSGDTS